MKPLVVIPARGGSKGVPRKNIKELGGKPLIYYTIEAARQLFDDKQIIVSTDDEEIKDFVERAGLKVPFLRPKELATDEASSQAVLEHALKYSEEIGYYPDVVILLQPTSPFRTAKHIKEAMELYTNDLDMVVSVKETKSNPYYVLFEEDKNGFLRKSKGGDYLRRQDIPKVWEYNGAIYIINKESLRIKGINKFLKIKKYAMPEINSIDIDYKLDWILAESIIKYFN